MRKALKFILVLLCGVSVAGYGFSHRVVHKNDSNAAPAISMDEREITISVEDDWQAMLAGITASDPEDGDVTSTLVVESLSNMIDHSYRNAVICAFDGNSHVAKVRRKVIYSDYYSPKFSLNAPLMAPSNTPSSVMDHIKVEDVFDGDISDQVQLITESTVSTTGVGDYPIHMFVANEAGDTVDLPVTLSTYSQADKVQAPVIELKDYLIYVDRDSKVVDAMAYLDTIQIKTRKWQWKPGDNSFSLLPDEDGEIRELTEKEEPLTAADLNIVNPVDTSVPGVYEILYQLRDYADNPAARIRLIVVVKE